MKVGGGAGGENLTKARVEGRNRSRIKCSMPATTPKSLNIRFNSLIKMAEQRVYRVIFTDKMETVSEATELVSVDARAHGTIAKESSPC